MENRANEAAEITLYKDMKLEKLRLKQELILYTRKRQLYYNY
jgi:hypothetical protein